MARATNKRLIASFYRNWVLSLDGRDLTIGQRYFVFVMYGTSRLW
jgi:hypothetical protein